MSGSGGFLFSTVSLTTGSSAMAANSKKSALSLAAF
jgi:hypothetical protein